MPEPTQNPAPPAQFKLGPRQQALVDALRSGKYAQGAGALRREDKFCCLGVACDLVNPDHWEYMPEQTLYLYGTKECADTASLPRNVVDYYGFRGSLGRFQGDPVEYKDHIAFGLYVLNDSLDWNFSQIADFIEARAQDVFTESK